MTYKIIPAGHANIDYEQKENEEIFWIFILYLESIQIDRKHFFVKHQNYSTLQDCKS